MSTSSRKPPLDIGDVCGDICVDRLPTGSRGSYRGSYCGYCKCRYYTCGCARSDCPFLRFLPFRMPCGKPVESNNAAGYSR